MLNFFLNKIPFYLLMIIFIILSCEDNRGYSNPFDPDTNTSFPLPQIQSLELYDVSNIRISIRSLPIEISPERKIPPNAFIIYRAINTNKVDESSFIDTVSYVSDPNNENLYFIFDSTFSMEKTYSYAVKGVFSDVVTDLSSEKQITTTIPNPHSLELEAIDDQSLKLSWSHPWTAINSKLGSHVPNTIKNIIEDSEDEKSVLKAQINKEEITPLEIISPTTLLSQSSPPVKLKFLIDRSTISGGGFATIDTIDGSMNEYVDKGLKLGRYFYEIRLLVNEIPSKPSVPKGINLEFPKPWFSSQAVTGANQISFQILTSTNYHKGIVIRRHTDVGEVVKVDTLGNNIQNYVDDGVPYNKEFQYSIFSFSEINKSDSSWSDWLNVTLPKPDITNVEATSVDSILLTWSSQNNFHTGYVIKRLNENEQVELEDSIKYDSEGSAQIISYNDSPVAYNTTYQYQIHAFSDSNKSPIANSEKIKVMLPKPYNIGASSYGNGIRLSWSIVPSFENGFSIERKLKSEDDKAFVVIDYLYANIGDPNYLYTDLNINTYSTYTYRVRSSSGSTITYYSDYSDKLSFTTFTGSVIYVSLLGSDNSGNGTESQPFKTIVHAVNNSDNGSIILLEDGIYNEQLTVSNRSIASRYIIDGDTDHISSTIIRGNEVGPVLTLREDASIVGLTIKNGEDGVDLGYGADIDNSVIEENINGAGILVNSRTSMSSTISNTIVRNNECTTCNHAAGIYAQLNNNYFKLTINNSTITDNKTIYTGDGYNRGSGISFINDSGYEHEVEINNSIITKNILQSDYRHTESIRGSGLYYGINSNTSNSSFIITDSKINFNKVVLKFDSDFYNYSAIQVASGLYITRTTITNNIQIHNSEISNNEIENLNNKEGFLGSTVYILDAPATFYNTTISNNSNHALYKANSIISTILNITNCIINGNNGAGLTGNIDGATLYNTIFENNIDGVVLNKNNSVTYCTFNSNDSTAINLKSQGNLIKNVTINNNHTGIMTGTGNSEFSNILVYGNNTGFRSNNTSLSLFNCTIASNEKGIHADGAGLAIQNSIIWDHKTQFELNNSSLTIVYSDISDGTNYSEWSSGEGNISLNPKFSNDYKLESGSPCINTGNPSSVYNDADGTRNDMGAFGGPEGNWWPHNF